MITLIAESFILSFLFSVCGLPIFTLCLAGYFYWIDEKWKISIKAEGGFYAGGETHHKPHNSGKDSVLGFENVCMGQWMYF